MALSFAPSPLCINNRTVLACSGRRIKPEPLFSPLFSSFWKYNFLHSLSAVNFSRSKFRKIFISIRNKVQFFLFDRVFDHLISDNFLLIVDYIFQSSFVTDRRIFQTDSTYRSFRHVYTASYSRVRVYVVRGGDNRFVDTPSRSVAESRDFRELSVHLPWQFAAFFPVLFHSPINDRLDNTVHSV